MGAAIRHSNAVEGILLIELILTLTCRSFYTAIVEVHVVKSNFEIDVNVLEDTIDLIRC